MENEEKRNTITSLKKEMDEFKTDVGQKFDTVKNLLEEIVNKDKVPNVVRITPETMENSTYNPAPKPQAVVNSIEPIVEKKPEPVREIALTPEQQAIFEKYFDPADGFKATYNVIESIFTIIVPLPLSNANEAYLSYYKQDIRPIKVDQNNPLGSIERWCALVTQNLQYNRKIRVKL